MASQECDQLRQKLVKLSRCRRVDMVCDDDKSSPIGTERQDCNRSCQSTSEPGWGKSEHE